MSLIILAAFLVVGDLNVTASLTDDTQLAGTLTELSADSIEIQPAGTEPARTVASESLKQLRFSSSTENTDDQSPPIVATLNGGSLLTARAIASDGQTIQLASTIQSAADAGGQVQLARSLLRSVQLLPLSKTQQKQFATLAESKVAADQAVIQRSERPLQSVEGAVGVINNQFVKFLFDGDWVDVKRPRVAGLIFYRAKDQPALTSKCQMFTRDGSRLEINALQLQGERLLVTLASGIKVRVPANNIERLAYSSGTTVYLSDLEPERWQYDSELKIKALASLEAQWFRPQANKTMNGQRLSTATTLGETVYKKGLGIHSRTELVYRISGEYRRFSATAGLDQLQNISKATIVVLTDETEQFRETIKTGQTVEIDVNLTGANRLTLRIEPSEDSELCDHVNLCDARISK